MDKQKISNRKDKIKISTIFSVASSVLFVFIGILCIIFSSGTNNATSGNDMDFSVFGYNASNISDLSINLTLGESISLGYDYNSNYDFKYISLESECAKLDEYYNLVAIALPESASEQATVTLCTTQGKSSLTFTLIVSNATTYVLKPNSTKTFSSAYSDCTFSSSNSSVCSVQGKTLSFVSDGTADIHVENSTMHLRFYVVCCDLSLYVNDVLVGDFSQISVGESDCINLNIVANGYSAKIENCVGFEIKSHAFGCAYQIEKTAENFSFDVVIEDKTRISYSGVFVK